MTLKRVVENLEDVEEQHRELYVERANGGYRLDAEEDDLKEIKQALANEREERKDIERKHQDASRRLEAFGEYDPAAIKEMEARLADVGESDAKYQEAAEALKKQYEDKHVAETTVLKDQLAAKDSLIARTFVEREAVGAINKHKGNVRLLLPEVAKYLRAVEVDGRLETRVVNDEGRERISPTPGRDGHMIADELVLELREQKDLAVAFASDAGSGGGAPKTSSGGAVTVGQKPVANMSEDEKMAFINEHGLEAWTQKLMKEVGGSNPFSTAQQAQVDAQSGAGSTPGQQ